MKSAFKICLKGSYGDDDMLKNIRKSFQFGRIIPDKKHINMIANGMIASFQEKIYDEYICCVNILTKQFNYIKNKIHENENILIMSILNEWNVSVLAPFISLQDWINMIRPIVMKYYKILNNMNKIQILWEINYKHRYDSYYGICNCMLCAFLYNNMMYFL